MMTRHFEGEVIESVFGSVRRWKVGDVLYAENYWVRMAYVATDDPEKLSGWKMGFHGPEQLCVGYITHETAKLWADAPEGETR